MPDIRINALATTAAAPAQDDFLELDGATNGTRKIRANAIQEWDSTRAVLGYLYSDGATSGRAQVQTPGARGNLAGAAQASWVGWVDVPTSNPSADIQIASLVSTITATPWSASSLYLNIAPAGPLQITQVNGSLSNSRIFSLTNFRSTYSGQRIWLEIRFTFGVSDPVVFINGVNVSSLFSIGILGSANWLDATTPNVYQLTGMNWPAGIAPLGCWLNAHLTNAESESWRITGRPPAWVAAGGSMVDLVQNGGFETVGAGGSDVFSWWAESNAGSSVIVRDTTDFYAGSASCRIDMDSSASNAYISGPVNLEVGKRYRLRFAAKCSVNGGSTSIRSASVNYGSVGLTNAWSMYTFDFTATISGGFEFVRSDPAQTNRSFWFDSVSIVQIGALSLPAVQPINVVEDLTALGGNQARLVGMVPVPISPAPISVIEIPARLFTGGTYVEILGGAITGPRKRRIVSVTGNTSAAANLHLGTTSSGTQIFGSPTVGVSGDFDIGNASFTTRIVPANASLHVMFSANTTASLHIHLTDL